MAIFLCRKLTRLLPGQGQPVAKEEFFLLKKNTLLSSAFAQVVRVAERETPMRTPTAAITVVLPAVAVVVMASFLAAAGEVELALDQAGSPTCANNLASCARYMNGTSMPPDGCCEPFRHSVVKEQRCLCDLLASPEIFKAFDIKESSFHDLANRCGLKDLNTLCPGENISVAAPIASVAPTSLVPIPSVAPTSLVADKNVTHGGSMKIGTIIGIALPATGAAIAIATLCSYIRRKRLARKTSIPDLRKIFPAKVS
nr:uncharacterized protein LOC107279289 isoform X3 [Oryza sativa Japonica Group]